jgi:hypothetical protein
MKNRDLPFFTETLTSEKKITEEEAVRAIYIDFEGFEAREPSLIGISIDNHFDQIILTPSLKSAAEAKGLSDLLPTSRTKVMEQSPLISENSGYETIQIYR